MSKTTLSERVDQLEQAIMRLLYVQQKTEMEIQALKEEMREFKEDTKRYRENLDKTVSELRKQWGHLSNKLGTIVEDFFLPSIDLAIEKAFGVTVDDVSPRRYVRKNGRSLELDILALSHKEKKAFVVEVKANPDREDYIDKFEKKLEELIQFLPQLEGYEVYPIYAAISMKQETVDKLTRRGIYAMVVKGDILEIVNLEKMKRK